MCDWYCERSDKVNRRPYTAKNKLVDLSIKDGSTPPEPDNEGLERARQYAERWGQTLRITFAEYGAMLLAEQLLLFEWMKNLHEVISGTELESIKNISEITIHRRAQDSYVVKWKTLHRNDRGGVDEMWYDIVVLATALRGYRLPEFLRRRFADPAAS